MQNIPMSFSLKWLKRIRNFLYRKISNWYFSGFFSDSDKSRIFRGALENSLRNIDNETVPEYRVQFIEAQIRFLFNELSLNTDYQEKVWKIFSDNYNKVLEESKSTAKFRDYIFDSQIKFIYKELSTPSENQEKVWELFKENHNRTVEDIATSIEHKVKFIDFQSQSVFKELLTQSEYQKFAWEIFRSKINQNYLALSEGMEKNLPHEQLMHLISGLLVMITKSGFLTFDRRKELFLMGQEMGIDILKTHFYSPIPFLPTLNQESKLSFSPVDLNLNPEKQLKLMSSFKCLIDELVEIPDDEPADDSFYWNNPAFNKTDAGFYYSMIRKFRPKKILEIGSGYSTLIADFAASKNGTTSIDIIEPYPLAFLKTAISNLGELTAEPVQEIPIEIFASLEENDFLFIDSTHISKYDSDLNYLVFNVLPAIQPGVIIHFHDIFLPYDYPPELIFDKLIFWNENYLLGALLMDNEKYEVMLSNYYLGENHAQEIQDVFSGIPNKVGGGSFWIRKTRK